MNFHGTKLLLGSWQLEQWLPIAYMYVTTCSMCLIVLLNWFDSLVLRKRINFQCLEWNEDLSDVYILIQLVQTTNKGICTTTISALLITHPHLQIPHDIEVAARRMTDVGILYYFSLFTNLVRRESKQTMGRLLKPLRHRMDILVHVRTCRDPVANDLQLQQGQVARMGHFASRRDWTGALRNSDPANLLSLTKCLFTHAHQSWSGSLTKGQLKKIRPKRLSNIICNNIGLSSVRETVLLVAPPRWFVKGKTSKKCLTCQDCVDNDQK